MIRRRRRAQEIAFGFDSFLDVVANVVGIIIRMILVVWVGARAYTALQMQAQAPRPAEATAQAPGDSLERELERHRQELAEAQNRLGVLLKRLDLAGESRSRSQGELSALVARRQALEQERSQLDHQEQKRGAGEKSASASLDDLRQRKQRLAQEIAALERQAPPGQALRYQVPVSRPVQDEELIFECKGGRISFVDVGAFLEDIRTRMREQAQLLRTRWEVADITGPVGDFRLHYTVERERGLGLPVPDPNADFRYGVSGWRVEPIRNERGEDVEQALQAGSHFRQIVDVLDSQFTAVTFCVYPDSFPIYRRLRDHLYQRDVVVAGRPLPEGYPIASSRHGTLSRGQ